MANAVGPRVVVLYGPKAVGKSTLAGVLRDHLSVRHVDTDSLVLDLLARGAHPDAHLGWLPYVEDAVRLALEAHPAVSVEATGAYDSDWLLLDHLLDAGVRAIPVWVWAPEDIALDRLAARTAERSVPVSKEEARRIHRAASNQAERRTFCATFDTSEPLVAAEVVERLRECLS